MFEQVVREVRAALVVQAVQVLFALAKAMAAPRVAVYWTQPQWHSPEVAQPRALQPAARRLAAEVANSWAVVAVGVAEFQAWSLPKERLPPVL